MADGTATAPAAPAPVAAAIDVPPTGGDWYEVIAQACAMAVADAVAYLRNTEIIANAAIGVAMEQLLADPDLAGPRAAIEAAQASVTAAVASLEAIGAASLQTLRAIPRPAQSVAAD
ncbi:MAG TPA: hypothetical protein VGG29_00125 [Caulobacteraceae bacterium]